MNEKNRARFRDLITQRLNDLAAALAEGKAATATVELDQQAIGRLSRQDALLNQAMANAGQARRATEQSRLLAALKRLDEDEYGYCDDCGEDIPLKRLELDTNKKIAQRIVTTVRLNIALSQWACFELSPRENRIAKKLAAQ